MFRQACLLCVLAWIPAWATAHFGWNWGPAPEFESIAARRILQNPAAFVLVDVRNPERFHAEHAPGAVLFTDATYAQDLEKLRGAFSKGQQIIVFGEGIGSERATRLARRLRKDLAPAPVRFLEGGWAAWPREQPR
jgi:rhodanese-related sulfurtransferase